MALYDSFYYTNTSYIPDLITNIFMPIKDLVSDLFLCTFKMISLLSSFLKGFKKQLFMAVLDLSCNA